MFYSKLSPEAQAVTFLHEVLHAMNSTMDHTFLESLAEQIYQFLHENKMSDECLSQLLIGGGRKSSAQNPDRVPRGR
jgi:hypothetical protein